MSKSIQLLRTVIATALVALFVIASGGCSRQAKASRHLGKGESAFAAGEYDKAEIEFLNVIKNDPNNRAAFTRLVKIYFDQGRIARAYPFLRRALQMDTNNPSLRLQAGYISMASGKPAEARDHAWFVLSQQPKDDDAPILLADAASTPQDIKDTRQRLQKLASGGDRAALQVALGILALRDQDLKLAEVAFRQALSLDPKFAAAHTAMAGIFQSRDDLQQAEQALKKAAELSPFRSIRRVDYARFKARSGDGAAARACLEEIVKKAPDFIPAWMALARLDFDERNYDQCAASLFRILSRDSEHYDATVMNAHVLLAKGDTAKARVQIEKLIKIYPRLSRPWYEMALVNLASDDPVKATGNLDQALSIEPNFSEAVLLRADLGIRRGDLGSAISSLQKFTKQNPQLPQPWFLLANAYRIQGKPEQALVIYQQLQKTSPSNAQPAFYSGIIYREMKKAAEARQAFNQALKVAPDFMLPLEQLVEMDVIDKQFDTALQRVQQPLQKYPKQPEPLMLQASVMIAEQTQAATNQAVSSLRKAIELQPDYRPAYFLLAQIYVASGQSKQAIAELTTVVNHNPKDRGALMLMGMITEQSREFDAARDYYEKAIAVAPNFAMAANNLACLYSDQFNQLDKAYAMARKARDASPKDPSIADTLGWILYKRAEYMDALTMLQESASQIPGRPAIQSHLGFAFYMMGFEDSARAAFQRALQLNIDFPEKADCSNCLAVLAFDPNASNAASGRSLLEKRLASNPNDLLALVRMASLYERAGETDKAVAAYQKVLETNPNNIKALTSLAVLTANRLKQPDKALELAKRANKAAPDDPAISHLLGRLAAQSGDCRWAVSLLQETSRKQPDDPEITYDLAEALFGLGQLKNAETAAQKALQAGTPEKFSRREEAAQFLDMIALSAQPTQAQAAQARVDKVLRGNPDYVPALLVSALIAEQKNQPDAACAVYQKILARYPDQSLANKRFALLSAEQAGPDRKPFQAATKAREALPADPEVAKALGIIVYNQKDYSRAAALLKESSAQLTSDPLAACYLGLAQYQLKQRAECKKSLQRALDLKLPERLVPETKRILAEK